MSVFNMSDIACIFLVNNCQTNLVYFTNTIKEKEKNITSLKNYTEIKQKLNFLYSTNKIKKKEKKKQENISLLKSTLTKVNVNGKAGIKFFKWYKVYFFKKYIYFFNLFIF